MIKTDDFSIETKLAIYSFVSQNKKAWEELIEYVDKISFESTEKCLKILRSADVSGVEATQHKVGREVGFVDGNRAFLDVFNKIASEIELKRQKEHLNN